jgi:protein-S-isoprenylcysteine O-methyltransferase Ste14
MVAGYSLYRFAGRYREEQHAGPPGFATPPDRLLTTGPYAQTRNPMYLGHLVFLVGLVITTRSPVAAACLVWQYVRLSDRVRIDEERLERRFGEQFRAYLTRAPRWV